MMLSKNPGVDEFSEWVSQSSDLLQPVDDQIDRGDLVQRLLSLGLGERTHGLNLVGEEASSDQANLLQQLLCLGDEGKDGDTKKEPIEQPDLLHQIVHLDGQSGVDKKYFNDTDIVDEVLVLEQENEFNCRLGDVKLFQNINNTLDYKALDQDIKTEMTDDNMTEDDDDKEVEAKEEIPHDRHISTVIYKNRLEGVGLVDLDPMYVISCSTNEFRDLTLSGRMAREQTDACKEVRKKGRNKQHATNCRSRKDNELKLLQRALRKKKEKFNKEKLLNAELLTDFGKREWEYEVLKHRCQKLVSWKIKWEEIETPFPTSVF